MRPWVLAYGGVAWLSIGTSAQSTAHSVEPTSVKLVDLLSASANHTLLLSAFQRARLIPTLNRLNGSTLWAPTNEAIERQAERERRRADELGPRIWSQVVHTDDLRPDSVERDNLQLALRDTLLYHIFNSTLFHPPPERGNESNPDVVQASKADRIPLNIPVLYETLYHPSLSPFNKSFPAPPSLPGSPPDRHDPDKPHDVEGLLRGQGQRVRLVRRLGGKNHVDEISIGIDSRGQGGAKVCGQTQFANNGALLPIDDVLEKPVDIGERRTWCDFLQQGVDACHTTATLIKTTPELSTLASLMPKDILDYASTAEHLTVFAPTNEAWEQLSELEMPVWRGL